jgi:hypothetical protein
MVRFLLTALAGLVLAEPAAAGAPDKFLALGTSSTGGVYFPVGKAICRLINEGRIEHRVRCVGYSTGGSVYNIQAVESGQLDIAITRADLAQQAYKGTGEFAALGPNRNLRAIANLYGQPVAVIVKADSGITGFDGMEGRRINIGNLGSGKRTIAELIFQVRGWSNDRFARVLELGTSRMGTAFCNGDVDILIEALGMPSGFYERMTRQCGGMFLSLPDRLVNGIRERAPFFYVDTIPGDHYPHNPRDVRTVGVKVVLITSTRVHPGAIGIVAQALLGDLKRLRAQNPVLQSATIETMLQEGIGIPFHEGAARYYQSKGLLKP